MRQDKITRWNALFARTTSQNYIGISCQAAGGIWSARDAKNKRLVKAIEMNTITLVYTNQQVTTYEILSSNLDKALSKIDEQIKSQDQKIIKISQVIINGKEMS